MFGAVGMELTRKGWPVIPAYGHTPCVPWRRYRQRAPAEIEVAGWVRQYSEANTTLILDEVVAVDCDAFDVTEAVLLGEAANDCFGPTSLVRVGRWPRHVRFFRRGRGVRSQAAAHVELKGRGQLVSVYGTHPITGRPYTYPGLELKDLRPSDLPLISKRQAQLFFESILPPREVERGVRGTGATGLTFEEAMRGVGEGRRHKAMLTIAYASRGWGYSEERARELVAKAAALCHPHLPVREAHNAVQWVFAHLPAGRQGQRHRQSENVPAILRIALRRALGGRQVMPGDRYELFVAMCREMQRFLGDKPVALPQIAVGRALKCSQPAVSKFIREALDEDILTVAEQRYRPGRRARLYWVIG